MLISLSNLSNFFVGNFVTTATIKVKIIRKFYTLAIVLANFQKEIGEKKSYLSLIGVGA